MPNLIMTEEHIRKSIEDAKNLVSKLDSFTLKVPGMANPPMKHLLNNLASFGAVDILEVGSYKGASSCSFLNNNKVNSFVSITWWSKPEWVEIGKTDREAFDKNIAQSNTNKASLTIFDRNVFDTFLPLYYTFDIFFYDGPHGEKETIDGITRFDANLRNQFLLIVDDFDDSLVRAGTFQAIYQSKWKVQKEWFLKGNGLNISESTDSFWNGVGIFLINK